MFNRLRDLARLHNRVHDAFVKRYGENNYLTVDYLVGIDGPKILNGLVRGLTPNLPEDERPVEAPQLATATADVEVQRLATLAKDLAAR